MTHSNRQPWRAQCYNDRMKPVRIPLSAVKWFGMRFNRSWNALQCVGQESKRKCCTFSTINVCVFPMLFPASILISTDFSVSLLEWKKTNLKSNLLFLSSYDRINHSLVSYFFAHCTCICVINSMIRMHWPKVASMINYRKMFLSEIPYNMS